MALCLDNESIGLHVSPISGWLCFTTIKSTELHFAVCEQELPAMASTFLNRDEITNRSTSLETQPTEQKKSFRPRCITSDNGNRACVILRVSCRPLSSLLLLFALAKNVPLAVSDTGFPC
jgi:hypothetical protein